MVRVKAFCWQLSLMVVWAIVALAAALPVGAAQAPTGAAAQMSEQMRALTQERRENEESLVWLIQGLRDMDKNKALRLTRDQAKKLLVIFDKWVKDGTVRIEVPKQPQPGAAGQNRTPNAQGQRPNQGNWNDPAQQKKLLSEMQSREAALVKDLDNAEKILTAAQVKFLDNMDFKADVYGLGGVGVATRGAGFGSAPGVWAGAPGGNAGGANQRVNNAQLERMRQEAQKKQETLIKLCKTVYDLLKQRAK